MWYRIAMEDGALPDKIKEFIAVSLFVLRKCGLYLEYHLAKVKTLGATRSEIAEALGVVLLKVGVPLRLTQKQLADHIGCDVKVINRIINNRSSVSTEMAVTLAFALQTTPEYWLNAQQAVDVYRARQKIMKIPEPLVHNE